MRRMATFRFRPALCFVLAAVLYLFLGLLVFGREGASAPPRLVVVIGIDGLPQQQVERNLEKFSPGGFRLLAERGAWFSQATYGHSSTFTGVGHATVLTGAYPYRHGIVANEWLDRKTGKTEYCVEDPEHQLLGEKTPALAGTSPRNLLVSTVGDELRLSDGFRSKVLSVSLKDRSAILMGGKTGTAYFFSTQSGNMVTSDYYRESYPGWWRKFSASRPQDAWLGKTWTPLLPLKDYLFPPSPANRIWSTAGRLQTDFPYRAGEKEGRTGAAYYWDLKSMPFGDELLLRFVEAAVRGEQLGKNPHGVPDILCIGFSVHDYVNHAFGPDSIQSEDHLLRLDRVLSRLFLFLDRWEEMDRTLVVLTADHGFPSVPEFAEAHGLGGGRIDSRKLKGELNSRLEEKFGQGEYILAWYNPTFYLNNSLLREKGIDETRLEAEARRFLLHYPGVAAVYTRSQLQNGELPATGLARQVSRSWDPQRSGDIVVIQKPYWYLLGNPQVNASTHGSPYFYDTNVPLMFLGPWFKPGRYPQNVDIVDLAPTLAFLLDTRPPGACEGRVLTEILAPTAGSQNPGHQEESSRGRN